MSSPQASTSTGPAGDQTPVELNKRLEKDLQAWRPIVVNLYRLLTWEQPSYPAIIGAFVTTIFLLIWLFDPSVLTTLSLIGIVATALDYCVPLLQDKLLSIHKWNDKHEKMYQNVCVELAASLHSVQNAWQAWQTLKEQKPTAYLIGLLSSLLFLAWVGNAVNNLLLTYLFILGITMFPGLKRQGHLDTVVAQIRSLIQQQITSRLPQSAGGSGSGDKKKK